MVFGNAFWLVALLPWAGVALYLLWGRRRREDVPFLELWLGPVTGPRPKRRLAPPPLALAAALLAMLLALLAAARPALPSRAGSGAAVMVILDRGATMSARGRTEARFVETFQRVADRMPRSPLDVRLVPPTRAGPRRATWSALSTELKTIPRTAIGTAPAMASAVRAALADTTGPVVVVSDHPLDGTDERVVRVAPEGPVRNAGIALVAARQDPRPQVMVRVRNNGAPAPAGVEIMTAGATFPATSPETGAAAASNSRDFFIDVPRLGDVVEARLTAAARDDFDGDDAAWLVREGSWPRLEARDPLPPELARMLEVYAKSRPAGDDSARVAVVTDVSHLPPNAPAAVVVPPVGTPAAASSRAVEVADHPITRNLPPSLGIDPATLRLADAPPGDWSAIVRVGGRPAVAVREQPARQVWVGLDDPDWPRKPAYVVFWGNAFDWLGGSAGPTFRSYPAGPLGPAWHRVAGTDPGPGSETEPGLWPGLYERAEDGARRAVNATDVQFSSPSPAESTGWESKLDAALAQSGVSTALAPGLLIASVACVAVAALTWRARPRTGPRADVPAGPQLDSVLGRS
jgi:hypothetical protein